MRNLQDKYIMDILFEIFQKLSLFKMKLILVTFYFGF